MNIREQIGNRITQSRKALGITIKELAKRTGELSAARICNWEQGTRSPGPAEARILASALDVSASFLLCLTDHPNGDLASSSKSIRMIPIVGIDQVHLLNSKKQSEPLLESVKTKIVLDSVLGRMPGAHTFAVVINDNSMEPNFNRQDLIIVDPDVKPNPGEFVLVHIKEKNVNCLRQYSESYSSDSKYQLLPLNKLWPVIEVNQPKDVIILGTVIEHRRFF